ncbi:MAG: TrmH family RNA methyltransferase [Blastocatellia bacterium]
MIITSPANERLKHARRVRDGRERGLIFVEGERLVEECLQSGLKLIACFHPPDPNPRAQSVITELARRDCPLYPTAEAALETVSDTVNTQGLIALAERPCSNLDQVLAAQGEMEPLVVCLDAVQDPGNFGTMVRTAEAAGASGVVALKGSVDVFAPKTLRSSMGSAFRLPIVTDVEGEEWLDEVRAAGLKIVAAAADGETVYSDYDWRQPVLVIFGSEARGVSEDLSERCDARLRIGLRAPVESLNVAAAAAVVLFEAARQRERL